MQAKVLIIGAGMTGLSAARRLTEGGCSVTLLDKGRGVGGRMATRRLNHEGQEGRVDHGAQFFTTRSEAFQQLTAVLQQDATVSEWCRGFGSDDGHGRYRGAISMNAVAKRLAEGLDIHVQQRVTRLQFEEDWRVETECGESFHANQVLLTAPVPQSLDLLEANGIHSPEELSTITYDPCLAVLAMLEGPSGLSHPGVMQFADGPVAWMADNQLKGISEVPTITLHANPDFSRAHFDVNRKAAGAMMIARVDQYLASPIVDWQVHGWHYSKPQKVFAQRSLHLQKGLWLAGDGFGAPRIEGAFLSGLDAAERMLSQINL